MKENDKLWSNLFRKSTKQQLAREEFIDDLFIADIYFFEKTPLSLEVERSGVIEKSVIFLRQRDGMLRLFGFNSSFLDDIEVDKLYPKVGDGVYMQNVSNIFSTFSTVYRLANIRPLRVLMMEKSGSSTPYDWEALSSPRARTYINTFEGLETSSSRRLFSELLDLLEKVRTSAILQQDGMFFEPTPSLYPYDMSGRIIGDDFVIRYSSIYGDNPMYFYEDQTGEICISAFALVLSWIRIKGQEGLYGKDVMENPESIAFAKGVIENLNYLTNNNARSR